MSDKGKEFHRCRTLFGAISHARMPKQAGAGVPDPVPLPVWLSESFGPPKARMESRMKAEVASGLVETNSQYVLGCKAKT